MVMITIRTWRAGEWLTRSLPLIICMLLGTACFSGAPVITIEEQEAKLSPIIVGSASVFMKIINSGSGADTLVSAKTNMADSIVELHDFIDGKMAKTDKMPIPSRSSVQLRPASYHLMIFKLPKEVKEGHAFMLTLSFEKSGDIRVPLQFSQKPTNAIK